MWKSRKTTPQRAGCILLVDLDEEGTGALAERLAARGIQVFFTAAPHVGRRLSQEYYFDLVVVDERLDHETSPPLSDVIARDGHRCVVLSVPPERHAIEAEAITVRGALRRPLEADRLFELSVEAARDASTERLRRLLDLVR